MLLGVFPVSIICSVTMPLFAHSVLAGPKGKPGAHLSISEHFADPLQPASHLRARLFPHPDQQTGDSKLLLHTPTPTVSTLQSMSSDPLICIGVSV